MSKKYYEKLLCDIQNQSKPVESKYGSYIMQKFGWVKGKGLGKQENGNLNIMKIKKYGEHGLGYEEHQEEEDKKGMWWENMYNNCAKKISQGKSNMALMNEPKEEKKKSENVKYSIFVKKSKSITLNLGNDNCAPSKLEDNASPSVNNFEKMNIKIDEKKANGLSTNMHNISEVHVQVKSSIVEGGYVKRKNGTGNLLINKVANKSKKKKKWKRNMWRDRVVHAKEAVSSEGRK
ncbi:hypothetical protein, conserved [Plasmodium gonderi]|uniref:G-patch domain-containing protein n=1 Tax=Plasmodium gonderi TaxID=77519 RepID=A0A1Y1JLF0_PLAGO|nr:hypothetical protein, conserved [Plasmodium gonderi]GAW80874.1 hypothetical protein, conserved [Plasmodium gonderi]